MQQKMQKVNECQLWHGTDFRIIEQICHQNFDWRLCSSSAAFGQGCYFARDASYSQSFVTADANGILYMFLADVLVGDCAQVCLLCLNVYFVRMFTLFECLLCSNVYFV